VFVGGALSAFLYGHAAIAAPLPASPQVSRPPLIATKPDAPRLLASEKTQVAKPKPPPATKTKGDPKGDQKEHEDDSDNPLDCLNDCFIGLGLLFDSSTPPSAAAPATAFASEASRWSVGSEAWLVAPTSMDHVALWESPSVPESLAVTTGTLAHGSHVVVVETYATSGGFWTRVRPFDGVDPSGWTPSWLLSEAPAPKPAPPHRPRPDPRWGLRLLLGGTGLGPADLDIEYGDGGLRADVQYIKLFKKQWVSGFGFGYRNLYGRPTQAYLSGTTLDDPMESRIQTYELGTRAGQRYGDRSGFRFDWMLGPTLAWVNERANMDVYTVVPPATLVPAGNRDDELGRWAGGGEFRANIGWHVNQDSEWGLHLGAFMFAWEGHEEHSLATDFVHSNIHGWDIGLSYTFVR